MSRLTGTKLVHKSVQLYFVWALWFPPHFKITISVAYFSLFDVYTPGKCPFTKGKPLNKNFKDRGNLKLFKTDIYKLYIDPSC